MILLGLIIFLGSIAWIGVVILAAASHPTGKVPSGKGAFVAGVAGVVVGLIIMAVGSFLWAWLLFGAAA